MITEMVVVEMGIQVDYPGHMGDVDVVEVHITATEEIALTVRGRILAMILLNGIRLTSQGMIVGAVFQVPKLKIQQAGKLSQVVGAVVEVVAAVVGVEPVMVTMVVGDIQVVVLTKIQGGEVVVPREVLTVGGKTFENTLSFQLQAGNGV